MDRISNRERPLSRREFDLHHGRDASEPIEPLAEQGVREQKDNADPRNDRGHRPTRSWWHEVPPSPPTQLGNAAPSLQFRAELSFALASYPVRRLDGCPYVTMTACSRSEQWRGDVIARRTGTSGLSGRNDGT